jgi:hypothetical protein
VVCLMSSKKMLEMQVSMFLTLFLISMTIRALSIQEKSYLSSRGIISVKLLVIAGLLLKSISAPGKLIPKHSMIHARIPSENLEQLFY